MLLYCPSHPLYPTVCVLEASGGGAEGVRDYVHLAELSGPFLRSQNLHFPLEGVIPMHPSSRHRTVIQEDISV